LSDTERKGGRHGGIDRIATLGEHLATRARGIDLRSDHHAPITLTRGVARRIGVGLGQQQDQKRAENPSRAL
jgi:hypothetical protein